MSIFKIGLIGKTPPGKFKDIIDHLTRVKKKKPDLLDVFPRQDMAGGGMLVQPSADGSRPGYAGEKREITTKVINKLDLDKKKITLSGDDFITGKVKGFVPEGVGKKYVDEYINFANKNYLKNDMSMVEPFQAYIKNKYPKKYAKIISDVNESGYRNLKDIHVTYKRALANELITAANNQLKFVNQFDILKKLIPSKRVGFYEKSGGLQARPPKWADKNTLNNFKNLDKMENKLSKALTYMVQNNVTIIDPKKVKIKGSGAKKPGASPIRLTMHYLVGGGSEDALNKALEINPWYQSQNFKVGDTTKNTFNYLSKQYGRDFIGQPFNDAYDFALQRRGRISLKGMKNQPLPENLIWDSAARSAIRNFNDGVPIDQWPVTILDKKGNVVDLGKFPVDSTGRKILNTSELQFKYNGEIFNRKNLKTKGVQSGFFNDVYKISSQLDDYLKQPVPDPDNPKKTISLKELFDKTEGRIFPTIGHDDARGGVKKRPFNNFKILTNVENLSLYNAYDKITDPQTRRYVANFIYGETKGLRGDRYKEAWTNKNVKLVTEYIKTGQGLEQTPYRQAVTMPPEQLKKLVATLSNDPRCSRGFKSQGGRAGFQDGNPPSLDVCYQGGVKNINSGMKNASPAQIKNFAEFANRTKRLGRNIMKFGILPEAMYVAADSTFRLAMGDSAIESLLRASEYLLPSDQTKLAEIMEAKRLSSPETAAIIGRSIDYKNQLAKIQSLEDQKANLELLSGRGDFDYIGDFSQNIKNVDAQLKKATDDLNNKFKITDPERLYAERMKDEVDDIRGTRSFLTKVKKFARDIDDREYGDVEDLETPQDTQKDLNQRMLPQAPTIYKVEGNKLLQKNLSEATTSEIMNHVQLLKPLGFNVSTKNLLAERDSLRGMPLSQQEQIFGKEATYGFSGTMGEPLNKGPVEKKQNVIRDMENEIVGRTNVNTQGQVINPFDIDISDIGSGVRGFAAAGGGIAKEAGDRSGPPPEKGPMSQGLQGLMKRVRNL